MAKEQVVKNVVLVGQAGTGKTMIAEAMLHLTGKTTRLGGHAGTKPTLDYDGQEGARGFSISTALAPIEWQCARINVLDAPCYPDFVGDAYTAMSAAETAMFVVDAADGPQTITTRLWYAAENLKTARAVVIKRLDRPKMLSAHLVQDGDVILGLPSSGIHSNGYSLVRKVAIEGKTVDELREPLDELGGKSLGNAVLAPTTIYAGALIRALKAGAPIHAMAHITGGGITENLNRCLPSNIDAVVDRCATDGASSDGFGEGPAWDVPPVISYMIRRAGLTPDEAYKTFNMGVGMSVLCAPSDVDRVRELLDAEGLESFVMGECVPGEGKVVYR